MNRYIVSGLATESDMRQAKSRLEAIQEGTTILILLELSKIGITFPEKCPHCGQKYSPSRYSASLACGGYDTDTCTNIELLEYVPKKEYEV